MTVFFIAEAGVNHNGSVERALQLIDIAADAGADAVKFQTFTAKKLAGPNSAKADYQKTETGPGSQLDMLSELELSEAEHRLLFDHCRERQVEFMSTPFDEEAVDFLVDLGMRRIKVASGEITNFALLRHIAKQDLPIILSTGMATLEEVLLAVATIEDERRASGFTQPTAEVLTVLHCTSNYPAKIEDANMLAMATIAAETGLPVGYSDHTVGNVAAIVAVSLGASAIEKHFTVDRNLPGPDHKASLEPAQLEELIALVKMASGSLGSGVKAPCEAELAVREVARRSICAARDLPEGRRLERSDLVLLRPATGIEPAKLESLPGRLLKRSVRASQPIEWADVV